MLSSRVKTKLRPCEPNKVKYLTKRNIASHVSKKRQNGSSEALNQVNLIIIPPITHKYVFNNECE